MTKVIADITMSLDGYVTGAGADPQHGLGDAEELHAWVMDQDAADTEILEQATARSGAVIMGRRLFDVIDGPDGWSADMGYGAQHAGCPAVLRRHPPRRRTTSAWPARSGCGSRSWTMSPPPSTRPAPRPANGTS